MRRRRGKRERGKEITTAERKLQNGVRARKEHHIVSTPWSEAAGNEEGGGPFRACGNAFVRKKRGDEVDVGKKREIERDREAVGRLAGQEEDEREASARRRTPGRIVKRGERRVGRRRGKRKRERKRERGKKKEKERKREDERRWKAGRDDEAR